MKSKIHAQAKNSKQTVVKTKNRKYFNPASKEVLTNLNNSFNKEKQNPQQEYMDQMKRKQRYTAFDINAPGDMVNKTQAKNRSGKLTSFSGTYYHGSTKLV